MSNRKATPATSLQKVQKHLSSDSGNKATLRSIIVKAQGEDETNAILEDTFQYAGTKLVEPPFHLMTLCMLRENSTELEQCIDAMVTNIDGFGYRLVEVPMTEEEKKANENNIKKEKAALCGFLENINFEDDITQLRMDTRRDIEDCGNAFWELIPFANKVGISSISRIEPQNVRLTRLDDESVVADMWFYNKYSNEIEKKIIRRRFRRYVQMVGSKKVFFKEWGDPRFISKKTGEVIPQSEVASKKGELASAMIHFRIKSNRTPYGIPRYIGNLFSIYGSRAADEINFVTFQNNNIPSMIVSISNGQLTDGSIKRIEEFIDTKIKGSNNRSSFLIIEAEPATEDQINPGTMKIDIKDLSSSQKEDQLFQNYDKNNADKLRRAFRLPPIFIGKSDDYNRATAQESRKLADEQVFGPKREAFDKFFNKFLVTEFEMKYHYFKSNSANITNDEDLVKVISGAEKTGGVTPNISRMILGDILNREIPLYDKDKINFDPDVPLSVTLVEMTKQTAGNPNAGVLAPNQGQIPSQENMDTVKILKDLEKLLTVGIFKEIEEENTDE